MQPKKGDHVGLKLKSYTFTRMIGAGAWGTVYEVYDDKTRNIAACKVIPKKLMEETPKLKELVKTEITVLQRCLNDNVIRYIDSFTTDKHVYILTEFCNGGDLEEYLKKKGKRLCEEEAREYLKQIMNGFRGLHEVGAMHRDFKSANILLHNGVAKIADLGFAKILKGQAVTGTILGTSVTMAPELLEGRSYGFQSDIWSVGVVYYQFLTGEYPYNGLSDAQILKKIKLSPPSFPQRIPISQESKDFIRKCLTIDPKKRISWKAMYDHPLLASMNKMREAYLGHLQSKINLKGNKQFYNKENIPQMNPNIGFEFQKAELGESNNLQLIQKEMKQRKKMEQTLMVYTQHYLEYRNKIMLTLKHGINPIYDMEKLPLNQNLYAFLMCKKAYVQIAQYYQMVVNKSNGFKFTAYWNEFIASQQYTGVQEQLKSDYEMVYMYTQNFMDEVKTYMQKNKIKNEKIQAELHLNTPTAMFQTIYKAELENYAFQLFDYRDRKEINKLILMKLITFIFDLINGITVSSDVYNRRIDELEISYMENQMTNLLNKIYQAQ